jgi:hypothetical protein
MDIKVSTGEKRELASLKDPFGSVTKRRFSSLQDEKEQDVEPLQPQQQQQHSHRGSNRSSNRNSETDLNEVYVSIPQSQSQSQPHSQPQAQSKQSTIAVNAPKQLTPAEREEREKKDEVRKELEELNAQAVILREAGDLDGAEDLWFQALLQGEAVLGDDDPVMLAMTNEVAAMSFEEQKWEQAEALYERVCMGSEAAYGFESKETLGAMKKLADTKRNLGNTDEAMVSV